MQTRLRIIGIAVVSLGCIGMGYWWAKQRPTSAPVISEVSEGSQSAEPLAFIDAEIAKSIHDLAQQYAAEGDDPMAAETFRYATAFDPENPRYHNDAGFMFWKTSQYERAQEHLERAHLLDPSTLRFANNLAALYVDTSDDNSAVQVLQEAHQNDAHVHYNMGYLYSKRDRQQEAILHLKKSLSYNANLDVARRLLERIESSAEVQ